MDGRVCPTALFHGTLCALFPPLRDAFPAGCFLSPSLFPLPSLLFFSLADTLLLLRGFIAVVIIPWPTHDTSLDPRYSIIVAESRTPLEGTATPDGW
ncbi:uncharacterized protein LY79DRAFT_545090 [Colletotrichum navitas]|uniref:Uncharacterized protein n=1 Tax=Colletotrichum navitas TaxID=681940 RepID=A0AAD8Q531_9PEZI|nr:uncharacterized protein LY79DRAFT_545090 [Colletotrichum navitas]KAK1596011.1 hypothetical protein LY79DRAFT_545090 [Colletotrichum navitas]